MGLDITDLGGSLSYRRLSLILKHSSRDTAFVRSVAGESADWSRTDHLLASVVDLLQGANWQRGGGKGSQPKPIPRPKPPSSKKRNLMTIPEMKEWLERRNR